MAEFLKYLLYAALVIAGFGLGFLTRWLKDRRRFTQAADNSSLARARNTLESTLAAHEFSLAKMQNTLASAAIDARRGEYELARQAASSFFIKLRAEAGKAEDSDLMPAQKAEVEPLFVKRDEIISLLARNDPAASEQLADLYVAFRELTTK
ncbi:MAG: hypothetical protein LLG44_10395 [Chloroflexi bacterium]|nr:hypothetical protein [Chloroflexota bacterium]